MEAARLPHWRGGHAWGMKANKREWRTARSWGSSVAVGHGGTRTNQRVPLRSREQQPYTRTQAARRAGGALLRGRALAHPYHVHKRVGCPGDGKQQPRTLCVHRSPMEPTNSHSGWSF